MPEETDLVIICKEDVDLSRHVDFTVRRSKVKAALEYKITNDPNYADLIIDENALSQWNRVWSTPWKEAREQGISHLVE